jgi:hypothetical protein
MGERNAGFIRPEATLGPLLPHKMRRSGRSVSQKNRTITASVGGFELPFILAGPGAARGKTRFEINSRNTSARSMVQRIRRFA